MIGANGRTRVFAYCAPVDMRKGFEGLSALVREQLGRDLPVPGIVITRTAHRDHLGSVIEIGAERRWADGGLLGEVAFLLAA